MGWAYSSVAQQPTGKHRVLSSSPSTKRKTQYEVILKQRDREMEMEREGKGEGQDKGGGRGRGGRQKVLEETSSSFTFEVVNREQQGQQAPF